MTTSFAAGEFTWGIYDTLLRLDFVSFAQHCFAELSPRTAFLMRWRLARVQYKAEHARMSLITAS